ncbi:unnamed protein product, partial [Adineta steineri]
TPWPHVTYRRVSRQFRKDEFQNTTNDGITQCITIEIDKENDVAEFLAQIDLTRLFVDKIEELANETVQIHFTMLQLAAHSSIQLSQQLDDITDDIRKLAYDVSTKLKKMEQIQEDQNATEKASAVWRIKRLQISNITRHFSEVMNQYNQESVLHRQTCKNIIKRELEMAHIHKTDDEIEEIIENGFPGTHSFSIMTDTKNTEGALNEIEARHREITKLENSLKALHSMFMDLARLLANKDVMTDNIEYNVLKAVEYDDDPAKQAQNAEDSDPDAAYTAINMEDNSRFMSDFFAHVDSLRTNIDKISELVDEVKRLHSTILAAPQADDRTKEELEEKMADIKKLANGVRQKLKETEQEQEQSQATSSKTQAQLRIEKSQLFVLTQKFRDVMNDYNQVQLGYRQKCKERIQRQLEITGRSVTEGEVEEMLESGNPAVFTQGIMVETAQAKQSLADIEARHGDIMKLEKSIKELHDMFIDMAALVQTQGEMIDRIEYNVVQSENFVKAASTDTKKAVKFQSAARRKLFIIIGIIICVLIVLAIILAIVFTQRK